MKHDTRDCSYITRPKIPWQMLRLAQVVGRGMPGPAVRSTVTVRTCSSDELPLPTTKKKEFKLKMPGPGLGPGRERPRP